MHSRQLIIDGFVKSELWRDLVDVSCSGWEHEHTAPFLGRSRDTNTLRQSWLGDGMNRPRTHSRDIVCELTPRNTLPGTSA